LKFLKTFARMTALLLQRADERQIKSFRAREELLRLSPAFRFLAATSAPHCLMASIATCCHLSRLSAAASASRCVTTPLRQQRHDAARAQLNGFLDDVLDDFSLGHGHEQRDGAGRGRREILQRHGKRDGIARAIFNRAKEFISDAVQHGDQFAVFHAQNAQRVVRLASVQPQRGPGAMFLAADKIGAFVEL
jgi:hypothetical protein